MLQEGRPHWRDSPDIVPSRKDGGKNGVAGWRAHRHGLSKQHGLSVFLRMILEFWAIYKIMKASIYWPS